MENKDFESWFSLRGKIHKKKQKVFFHEREVWWCSTGENIGFEQNGKGKEFTRPVIIIKRLSLDTCLIIPLTTSTKRKNTILLDVLDKDKKSFAMVEQIRLIDAKRLGLKIGSISKSKFIELVEFTKKINFSGI